MNAIALATEDALSEAIGLRLLAETAFRDVKPQLLRKDGFGYLRKGMPNWVKMASFQSVLVLTDLDRLPCPVALLNDWLPAAGAPRGLLLRIAVRSIESWVMADHVALRRLIGPKGRLPPEPDLLPEPKTHLLTLARHAPRAVRDDLVAPKGAMASQGMGYNQRLVSWVQSDWSPERAAERSESLRRAMKAVKALADSVH